MNLIIGASGRLGSRIGQRLLERGKPVRAVSRDPARLADLQGRGAEVIRGDLRESQWLDAALKGVRRIVLAAQGVFPPSRTNHPETVDLEGNQRAINAAQRAAVDHVVFVSVVFAEPEAPVKFGRVKHATEEHLKRSGLAYTIIRPTTFIEAHGIEFMAEPLREKGKVQLFGRGQTPLNWISASDVADDVVRALENPKARNTTRVIAGPDVLTRLQVLELIERVLGRQAKRNHVPVGAMRAMRVLLGPLHPGMKYLLDAVLAEETMPDHPAWAPRQVDWTAPTTVEAAVRDWAVKG